jgi:RNA polymerase sigma-70 factor (ECF subfamily)
MFYFDTTRSFLGVTQQAVESDLTENEWVERARQGDEDAFVHLASHYRPRLWSTASRFARSREELEDLVQELLVKIWKGLPAFRFDSPFEHWVMTVAVRGCYDFLRSQRTRREREFPMDPETGDSASDGTTEPTNARREAWEVVTLLLSHLEAKDRLLITLLDLEERGVRETAALTGWTESNVKVRAHRARKKMQQLYFELRLES